MIRLVKQWRSNLWLVIQPAESIPGEWVAHWLDLDLVTQGRSPEHALEMALEAASIIILDDLARGFDPLARRAPEEFWVGLRGILRGTTRSSPATRSKLRRCMMVTRLPVVLWPGEDGQVVATCPVIPGCISQGADRVHALANIQEAIELCLEARVDEVLAFRREAPAPGRSCSNTASDRETH